MAHRAAAAGRRDLAAVGIEQEGLDTLRADVRADQVAHLSPDESVCRCWRAATRGRPPVARLQSFVDEPPGGFVLLPVIELEVEGIDHARAQNEQVDGPEPV